MTVRIALELDMDSYNKKYGPGSEWHAKYYSGQDRECWQDNPNWLKEAIEDVLQEGFWDWHSQGWMKVQIQQS